jgi:glycosyltransferase involved in cell wall biosynthesis
MRPPRISAVMRAYNAEQYIGESLAAILSQSRPAEEVIVVDDGSTDGTLEQLARFGSEIRVVRQPNRGYAEALNRCFREASGDYVANCDADDIWEPEKLARQVEAVTAHPKIDIAFGAIWVFGETGEWPLSLHRTGERTLLTAAGDSSVGIMDQRRFATTMYRNDVICPSSTLVRRELYERLGPFAEHLAAEDYDYWMRALRAGAVFYYDPARLVRYRTHSTQLTADVLGMIRAGHEVRALHADIIDDRRLVHTVHNNDLFRIGRLLVDEDRPRDARDAFRQSLAHAQGGTASENARALGWIVVLSLPARVRGRLGRAMVGCSRALDNIFGTRQPTLS